MGNQTRRTGNRSADAEPSSELPDSARRYRILGEVATAKERASEPPNERDETDAASPPTIHPHFGYSGTSDDEIPNRLEPDQTVELHVDEDKIDESNLPALRVEFGALYRSRGDDTRPRSTLISRLF